MNISVCTWLVRISHLHHCNAKIDQVRSARFALSFYRRFLSLTLTGAVNFSIPVLGLVSKQHLQRGLLKLLLFLISK